MDNSEEIEFTVQYLKRIARKAAISVLPGLINLIGSILMLYTIASTFMHCNGVIGDGCNGGIAGWSLFLFLPIALINLLIINLLTRHSLKIENKISSDIMLNPEISRLLKTIKKTYHFSIRAGLSTIIVCIIDFVLMINR